MLLERRGGCSFRSLAEISRMSSHKEARLQAPEQRYLSGTCDKRSFLEYTPKFLKMKLWIVLYSYIIQNSLRPQVPQRRGDKQKDRESYLGYGERSFCAINEVYAVLAV
jgi:hypothetical protein